MRRVSYNVAVAALATEGATAAEPDAGGRPVDAEELSRDASFTVTTATGEELRYEPRKRAEKPPSPDKADRGGESRLVAELRTTVTEQSRLMIEAHKRLDAVSDSHAKLLHESLATFAALRQALTSAQEPESALKIILDRLSPMAAKLERPLSLLLVGLASQYCPGDPGEPLPAEPGPAAEPEPIKVSM